MRRPDWPDRYAAALEAARSAEFSDRYYCAVFAADVVLAMTDSDALEGLRGLTQREARRAMARAGESIRARLERLFGPHVHPSAARRGDVVLRRGEGLMIGICVGAAAAFLSDRGVDYHPLSEAIEAYRV